MKEKILSPKSDFIFKLIFGNDNNKDVLASFLQSILDLPDGEYTHLTIVDPHLQRKTVNDKLGILDVKIHTTTGKVIDVEIQVLSNFPQMRERILFYSSKMITEQIQSGDGYEKIKRVICIVITNYPLIRENEAYHNRYFLYDKKTGSQFSDILEINTLELPKLPDITDDSGLWDWMQFLRTEREEDYTMLAKKNPKIKKAFHALIELSQDEETRMMYESREKARRDEHARMQAAIKEGLERGQTEGMAKGIAEGRAEGMAKGIAVGRTDTIVETVKTALQMQMKIEDIMKLTKLTREEIADISKRN